MKEQVTDIFKALKLLQEELNSLKVITALQQEKISELTRSNQRYSKENRMLRDRLSKYEKPPKDSSNSSTPPSKESLKAEVIRRTQSLRKKSDKPIGGQIGHEGAVLEKFKTVDEVIENDSSFCRDCGQRLSVSSKVIESTTQVVDLPKIQPIITEYKHFAIKCQCGCVNRSENPVRGGNRMIYSSKIKALVTYLNTVQFLPYKRLREMLQDLFGLKLSQGSIKNFLNLAKEKSAEAIEIIKQRIAKSPVVGSDESRCHCAGRLDWSWITQTPECSLFFRAKNRSAKVLQDMFGDNLKNMTVVTDRHAAYFTLDFKNHQICLAHILRELKYLAELREDQHWSFDVEKLLQEAIHLRNETPDKPINTKPWLKKLDYLLESAVEKFGDNFRRLKNGLIKCRDYIFNFLENPSIPPTNNESESGVRKLKIKQKISGTFTSDDGADAFHALLSIVETARKNNCPQLEAVHAIF